MKSFVSKVALVTGGSRRIGASIVRRLARYGASVAFTCSNSEQNTVELSNEIESSVGKALALKADSTCDRELHALIVQPLTLVVHAVQQFGSHARCINTLARHPCSSQDIERIGLSGATAAVLE